VWRVSSDDRRRGARLDRDFGPGRGTGLDPCRGRGPSGDRVPAGRDLPPSNPHKIALRHGAARPTGRLHREGASSSHRATGSDGRPDTNTRRSMQIPGLDLEAKREPHGDAAAGQFGCQQRLGLGMTMQLPEASRQEAGMFESNFERYRIFVYSAD